MYHDHPLFSSDPTALQIIGYYDDIEVCNPLGSSAKKHKLSVFLFSIGNLHPKYRSSLKCIYLFAVAKADDVSTYSTDAILSSFISDIKILATSGISVVCRSGAARTFKGSLLAFLADNVASHAIGGFKGSFSRSYWFCRSCMATHSQASSNFVALVSQPRTPDSHKHHCSLLKGVLQEHHSCTYGVNRRSKLEDIFGFSVVRNLPHDVMHDLLEGIVHDELTLLLNHCVFCKHFSFSEVK